ncbi:hypothetical protein CC78DRAFT_583181 [Lojkania enalia]|uniref:F-box domain-containing protein n=1 Tax=Lojkania enalia TaxID=147567 RepID=A0A9P4N4G9_9PLEO|nr:hypothetical protein CC78DRAFT_583181 [Didymosphaeria enalia]
MDSLPDELLAQILAVVVGEEDTAFHVRRTLCLVNHRFCRIVSPWLYVAYEPHGTTNHLDFLLPLARHEVLADAVKTVGYCAEGSREPSAAPLRIPKEVMSKIESLEFPVPQPLDYALARWDDELGLLALISLTANLQELRVDQTSYEARHDQKNESPKRRIPIWLYPIREAALGKSFGTAHSFDKLADFTIGMHAVKTDSIAPVFYLPSLRRLRLTNWVEDSNAATDWPVPAASSFIEELSFVGCAAPAVPLAAMIVSCKTLRKFDFFYAGPGFTLSVDKFWLDRVGGALLYQRDYLEHLDFFLPHPEDISNRFPTSWRGRLGPLSRFSKLQFALYPVLGGLIARLEHDHDIETLLPPRSIVEIELRANSYEGETVTAILDKLLKKHEEYPFLRSVSISVTARPLGDPLRLNDYTEMFAEHHIRFMFKTYGER